MVRKEIWTSLLAYNLIRRRMLQAAAESDRSPRQLSFTTAMQNIAACWMVRLQLDEERRIASAIPGLRGGCSLEVVKWVRNASSLENQR